MGFTVETSVSALAVFFQGLLSFFSPCVLPLIPLYLGYLAGGASAEDLTDRQRRRLTLRNTLFFILGISFAFFVLWDVPESEAVWAEKLRFFLDYPELTEFRRQVRENLGLEQPEQAA